MLSDAQLAEIRERCDKATPGPWRVGRAWFECHIQHRLSGGWHGGKGCRYTFSGWPEPEEDGSPFPIRRDPGYKDGDEEADNASIAGIYNYGDGGVRTRQDADFIAHAREDIPLLLAEVRRLRAIERAVIEEQAASKEEQELANRYGTQWVDSPQIAAALDAAARRWIAAQTRLNAALEQTGEGEANHNG